MTIILLIALFIFVTYGTIVMIRSNLHARRAKRDVTGFSTGDSIEADCRACGQFNRVACERLRDRPKCGRCKKRLMPGKRLVIVRVKPMNRELSRDLDACWQDEDRLWSTLADHHVLRRHAEDDKHVVN